MSHVLGAVAPKIGIFWTNRSFRALLDLQIIFVFADHFWTCRSLLYLRIILVWRTSINFEKPKAPVASETWKQGSRSLVRYALFSSSRRLRCRRVRSSSPGLVFLAGSSLSATERIRRLAAESVGKRRTSRKAAKFARKKRKTAVTWLQVTAAVEAGDGECPVCYVEWYICSLL